MFKKLKEKKGFTLVELISISNPGNPCSTVNPSTDRLY